VHRFNCFGENEAFHPLPAGNINLGHSNSLRFGVIYIRFVVKTFLGMLQKLKYVLKPLPSGASKFTKAKNVGFPEKRCCVRPTYLFEIRV
jgi:hypothetical protein